MIIDSTGEIVPEGWEKKLLKQCLENLKSGKFVERGWSPQCLSHPTENTWGVLKTTAVQMGEYLPEYNKELPETLEPKVGLEVNDGDFLVTTTGPRNRCGVICHVRTTPKKLIFSGKILRFRADENQVLPTFLMYLLMSPSYQKVLDKLKVGTSDSSVSIGNQQILDLEIPLASIEEQGKIVEILEAQFSRLNAALASVGLIREKAARFRRSLLHAAFTGELSGHVLSEKSLPDGWRQEAISDIANGGLFVDGDWVESKDQDPSGSVRLTQLADVGEGVFRNRSDRWMREDQAARLGVTYLAEGDLLIARMPEPLGRCCLVPPISAPSVTVVDVAVLRPDQSRYNSKYVMWILNSPAIRQAIERESSGTTRVRISRKNLGTIKIPVPPYSEQNAIVAILEEQFTRLDASMKLADAIESKASALQRSLLHSAFTGELTKEWREGAHV